MIAHLLVALLSLPVFLISVTPVRSAPPDALNIYIDADFSVAPLVAESIELGLQTALSETDGHVAGLPVSVRRLDHRSNPRRSNQNFKTFLRDPNALAMLGGMQSPPYLTYGNDINANQVPLLLGWAAGAPITRFADGNQNYIFRLSVDDRQAGPFLVNQAVGNGCREIALLLVDTGWGRANYQTITAALQTRDIVPTLTVMVPSDVGQAEARNIARDIAQSRASCGLFVLSNATSATVFTAMHDMLVDIDVYSHWGIFNEDFPTSVSHTVRQALNLRFLQTCGLNVERRGSATLAQALLRARSLDPNIDELRDIGAPAGFVHGFDLGRLLRAAAEQASRTPDWPREPAKRRAAFRDALANLHDPVTGIMKTYNPPFADLTATNRDGHEALGQDSLCLAAYDEDDRIVVADD